MRTFRTPHDLKEAIGQEVGLSDWLEITQDRIDTFAEATGDDQWIHVNPEKAATGPFGTTIAHGYLTLSLLAPLMQETYRVEERKMGVNYGLNKVRFPSPVPVGSRVRARNTLRSVEDVAGGVQATFVVTVELEGAEKPACVAEALVRLYA